MKFLLFMVILSSLAYISFCAVAIGPPNKNYPGKCFSEDTGVMTPGQEVFLKGCGKATCDSGGSIQFVSCGVRVINGKKCELVEDLKSTYPECCSECK